MPAGFLGGSQQEAQGQGRSTGTAPGAPGCQLVCVMKGCQRAPLEGEICPLAVASIICTRQVIKPRLVCTNIDFYPVEWQRWSVRRTIKLPPHAGR